VSSFIAAIRQIRDDGATLGIDTPGESAEEQIRMEEAAHAAAIRVTRRAATEFAFSGALYDQHAAGSTVASIAATHFFDSRAKFDSGTGWPSFWKQSPPKCPPEKDFSAGVLRTEVKCTLCDAHLGHVFTDGPEPTGLATA